MLRTILSVALTFLLTGLLVAAAQNTNKTAQTDRDFLNAAANIDMAEMKLGHLAQENAMTPAVKKFGERLVSDHTKMNQELRKIAQAQGVTLPSKLDQKHQDLVNQLTSTKGMDFDRTYAKDMVSGHEKAIKTFEAEAKNGQDPDVKAWAEKWLPTLREHRELAREAVKDVKNNR
jgi:putative membrane protein